MSQRPVLHPFGEGAPPETIVTLEVMVLWGEGGIDLRWIPIQWIRADGAARARARVASNGLPFSSVARPNLILCDSDSNRSE